MKHMAQRNFEEMVGSGSYFGSGSGNFGSGSGLSSRGIQGPMDGFLTDLEENEDDGVVAHKITPTTTKEARNEVCLDIGRFFFENGISFNDFRSPSFVKMLRSVGNYG